MIGTVVGNYRITSELARGGMEVIYRAEHVGMGQQAVIKQMLPEFVRNPASVERFFHEAKAAAAIDDPGIVKIFDSGTLPDGSTFITMELLKGQWSVVADAGGDVRAALGACRRSCAPARDHPSRSQTR